MKLLFATLLFLSSASAFAEGACPPGQYPIGGQGVQGCAPIGGGTSAPAAAPRPAGKWETRWGAVAEDYSAAERGVVTATGVAESRKSRRDAVATALDQCEKAGGQKCKLVIAYHNQCVAMADPKPRSQGGPGGKSVALGAATLELARSEVLKQCSPDGTGQCSITYSACSMSEFKSF